MRDFRYVESSPDGFAVRRFQRFSGVARSSDGVTTDLLDGTRRRPEMDTEQPHEFSEML